MSGFAPNPAEMTAKTSTHAVWKFHPLEPGCFTGKIEMPEGAEILRVDMQADRLTLWALVDTGAKTEERTFRMVGTGHRVVGDDNYYIGSVFDGPYVWHFFEEDLA